MKAHRESVDIDAPAAGAWQTLLDFAGYPRWNRTIPRAAGEARPGARLALRLELGTEGRDFDPDVVEVVPGCLLLLAKVAGHPAVLRVEHAFRLEPRGEGRCRLTQEWRATGVLAALAWPRLCAGFPAFARMGADLAREAERAEVARA